MRRAYTSAELTAVAEQAAERCCGEVYLEIELTGVRAGFEPVVVKATLSGHSVNAYGLVILRGKT